MSAAHNKVQTKITLTQIVQLTTEGKSIRYEIARENVYIDLKTNEVIKNRKWKDKEWQLEKHGEEFCFKTFGSYDKIREKTFFTKEKPDYKSINTMHNVIGFSKQELESIFNIEDNDWFGYMYKGEHRKLEPYHYSNSRITTIGGREAKEELKGERRFVIFNTRDIKEFAGQKNGENAIRIELDKYIEEIYPNEPTMDEYTTLALRTRADTAVFTKNGIHVFEIKSEKDSFARLENQIKDYKTYAEKVTIVLHVKKLSAFMKNHTHLLDNIGLMVYYGKNIPLEIKIKPKKMVPSVKKVDMLWADEARSILSIFRNTSQLSTSTLRTKALESIMTKPQAHHICNLILHRRVASKDSKGHMQYGSIDINKEFLMKFGLSHERLQHKLDKIIQNFKRPILPKKDCFENTR